MDPRIEISRLPSERLAAVARSLLVKMAKCSACNSQMPPNTPDYADFRTALEPFLEIELLKRQIDEAKRTPGNERRVSELQLQLGAAYFAASHVAARL